jgi:hypothetical protein
MPAEMHLGQVLQKIKRKGRRGVGGQSIRQPRRRRRPDEGLRMAKEAVGRYGKELAKIN